MPENLVRRDSKKKKAIMVEKSKRIQKDPMATLSAVLFFATATFQLTTGRFWTRLARP